MEYNIKSPYYIRKANGGLSPCIEGNNAYGLRPFPGSVLPNCVGAAVAEFNRMIFGDENPQIKYLGNRNAVDFAKFPAEQGLETGQMPRVGACMVWGHGEGHVGVVKQVINDDPNDLANNEVINLESGWSYRAQPILREVRRKRGKDGKWGYSWPFLLFIYPPGGPEPPEPEQPIYYTVRRGDNLTKIARKYATTVAQLVIWNNIKNPNLIFPGQVLIVGKKEPEPPQPPEEYYTVQRGDNLTRIAQRFGTNVKQLVAWNNIPNPNLIFPGQVLRVK